MSTFEGLLQNPSSSSDLPLIGPLLWRHTPRFCNDARSIQISQNIHACRKASMQAAAAL